MHRIVLIGGIAVTLVILTSCISVRDCKSDGDCFEMALQDCDRAIAKIPSMMADYVWEITGEEDGRCKVHYTIDTLMRIEKDCYIRKNTRLNGTSKMEKAVNIKKHLEDCGDEIRS